MSRLFDALAEVVPASQIGPWLDIPNSAFEGSTPLQVIERGESDRRERQKVGGQAALRSCSCVCGCGLNFGYQRRNRSSRSSLSTFVLVCSKRWAPRSVHCICCFLTNRLLTTWFIVHSTNSVQIVFPF